MGVEDQYLRLGAVAQFCRECAVQQGGVYGVVGAVFDIHIAGYGVALGGGGDHRLAGRTVISKRKALRPFVFAGGRGLGLGLWLRRHRLRLGSGGILFRQLAVGRP